MAELTRGAFLPPPSNIGYARTPSKIGLIIHWQEARTCSDRAIMLLSNGNQTLLNRISDAFDMKSNHFGPVIPTQLKKVLKN